MNFKYIRSKDSAYVLREINYRKRQKRSGNQLSTAVQLRSSIDHIRKCRLSVYSGGVMPGRQAGSGFGKYNAESPTQGSKRFNSPVRRNTFSYLVIINPCVYLHRYHCTICIEEETDKREGKGFRCCLGDVLECRTSHLAARMIGRQVVGRISIWGGWGFDVV